MFPKAEVIIDRRFNTQPPDCLKRVSSFRFKCTPDPNQPDYCIESFGELSADAAQAIANQLVCAQRASEWVRTEEEARGAK